MSLAVRRDESTLKQVMEFYDPSGKGEINFATFCNRVMGEHNDDLTGWTSKSSTTHAPDMDPRNVRLILHWRCCLLSLMCCCAPQYAKMLLRKMRENFKGLYMALSRRDLGNDNVDPADLKRALGCLAIDIPTDHFTELLEMFDDGSGGFLYKKFLQWVRANTSD